MADVILQATLSNVLISAFLAVVAWFIHKRFQAATLANIIWIMVLIKMVTPPLFAIPLLEVNAIAGSEPTAEMVAPLGATLLSVDGKIRQPVDSGGMTLPPAATRWIWLGWFAFVALWWNPVLWVTRRQLRITEEIACDALVVDTVRPQNKNMCVLY